MSLLRTFLFLTISGSPLITGWATTQSPENRLQGPIFLSEPPSSLVFANTHGALVPCTAYGKPAPALDWIKDDGSAVDDVPGLLKVLSNNTLQFYPFDDTSFQDDVHTQTYRCLATNIAGSVLSRPMQVKSVLIDDYKTYNLQLTDVWAMKGSTATFTCVINPSYVKEYIKVVGWTQGTKPIVPGDRVSFFPDGKLQIRDVRDEDRYTTYRCIARNILTKEEKVSSFAYLHVHEPPAGWSPAEIDDYSKIVTVAQGSAVELPCVGRGNPLPTYRWSFHGKDLSIDNVLYGQRGGNLFIKNAQTVNSGDYTCNISNSHGSAIVKTQLIVTLPLSVKIDPPKQIVDSGQSAFFNCSVNGYPIKSIQWYKNGHLLVKEDRMTIQDETYLTINKVNRMDQAMYQCVITNDNDGAQGTTQLLLGAAHPAFVDLFADQYVQIGQKTSIKCNAAGNPTPNVSWTLDGQSLPHDNALKEGSFMNGLGEVISYVNISSVDIIYGGEYTCKVSNEVGTISHSNRLNVYGIPWVRPMKNITATANQPLIITCYVAGYPVSSVIWSKDGTALPHNHLQHIVGGTLTIDKVQKRHDSGKYVCTARNSNGQGSNQSVYINIVEPPMIDPFTFPVKKQGDRIVISCVVSSGDQPIKIKWTKDGHNIPPDMGIKIQLLDSYTSMFIIGDASTKHTGNYTCQASNPASTVTYTSLLQVDVPPTWINEPEDSFVILKKNVILDCLTNGIPAPKISWKKGLGDTLGSYQALPYTEDNSDDSSRLQLLSNGTLVIRNAEEEDHGHYLCHADNGVGYPLSKVIFLTVHIPARFDEPSKNYSVIKGKNTTLECQAVGDKPMSVSWSFNGKSLSSSSRKRIERITTNRGMLSRLVIRPSGRDDTGFYVCTAANKFGNGILSMRLVVLEKPEVPLNLTVVSKTSRETVIEWKKPYDGNTDILFYVIEYIKSTGTWQGIIPNITVPSTELSVNIPNLQPSVPYLVRIRANNSVGYGIPCQPVDIVMLEEAPSGPPQNIEVTALGSESLQITWMPPAAKHINGKILGYYIGYKMTDSPARFLYIPKVIGKDFKPEHTLHNLEKFTEYSVHIQAYNAKGRGPSSPDYKVFTLEDVPSQPPQGVQATSINSRSIKIIWSPPPLYTLHGILQGYKILYQPVRDDEDESDANTLITDNLEAIVTGLSKYTNYSLQVLAYTRKGVGVRSPAIYVVTQQDVPERPADIKALPVDNSSILVSWKPPLHSNGILTRYNVYITGGTYKEKTPMKLDASKLTLLLSNLSSNLDYLFQVSANTRMGEGERTQIVSGSIQSEVSAKIASFSSVLTIPWHHPLNLSCLAVGIPSPTITWKIRGKTVVPDKRFKFLPDGSLYIDAVVGSDAANYTCHAENTHGTDQIVYAVSVQVSNTIGTPPKPPVLYVVTGTASTIQVSWKSGSNGGSPIQRFSLRYKKEHEEWKHMDLGSSNRSYTASRLLCGTSYKFVLNAQNKHGDSPDSNVVSAKTNGSTPIMPAKSMLLKATNVTSVDLDMTSWLTAGCPIKFYSIKYQVWGDDKWKEVANHIDWNVTLFRVLDLHPATWYKMIVTAYSDAGSTEGPLEFATLNYHGELITPIYISNKYERRFYEKEIVMIPLCAGIVSTCVLLVGVLLYCKRKRELLRLKDTFKLSSNLRRDITAETSLMNDLDKRLNCDYDSSSGNSEPFTKRNVNLLMSLNSDDNLLENSPSWLFNTDTSKSNSENGSFEKSDDDGNINPYATFNEMKQALKERTTTDMDDISLEKAEAQRAMLTEPYVPFYKQKSKYPEKLAPVPPVKPPNIIPTSNTEGYDNEGMALSPRKYASADQIHALFTTSHGRQHNLYGKVRNTPHHASDDKASLRHSIISSVTTVSSSRDELLEALENARRNPPPSVLYESQQDTSSQLTDSPGEPGILQFTQSPPKPNEQREAACQFRPKQDKKWTGQKIDVETDVTEIGKQSTGHPRKTRGKHKTKQRGQLTGKRNISQNVKRTPSMNSTTSSEEITYTFGGKETPPRYSPSEGYLSYPHESYPESDYSISKRVGRSTPHTKTRYDVSLQTPLSDENKPLVASFARHGLASSTEQNEEAVRLLDRHYRPVEIGGAVILTDRTRSSDKGYTEDFTIV